MNIKKICIVIFKMMLIIFLVITFNLIMMPKYINENQDGRIIAEMYKEKSGYDVLFLGSSTVYSGVSPVCMYENSGITSLVAASSSQTSWQSYYVLKEALKYNKPKLVVLDIGFMYMEDDYADETANRKLFDYMRFDTNKYNGVKLSMSDEESLVSYLLPVLRFHARYDDLSVDDFKYAFFKPGVTHNGYIINYNFATELPNYFTMDVGQERNFSDTNRFYLQSIIDECKDNGCDVLLMKMPSYTPKWNYEYEGKMQDMASTNGINYINYDNYSDYYCMDWLSDSPDAGGHLNTFGAEKFSRFLANNLQENYGLNDWRKDEKVNLIWSEKMEKYEKAKLDKVLGN